jgi:uncharacterized membrane protein YfhO
MKFFTNIKNPKLIKILINFKENYQKLKNKLHIFELKTIKIKSIILIATSFLLPALILLWSYASIGVYPFGNKSILIMDLNQMSDIIASFKNLLGVNNSIFYSWSKALGDNNMGTFAFYLSSPFTFVTLLFPNNLFPTSLMVMNLIKIGSAGLTFCLYLKFVFKKNDLSLVLFSLFYALMSYSIVYSMLLMWLDGLIWLPIVLIGIEKLLKDNKPILLIVSLMMMFIATYYLSYMIGIFCVIYFIYRYLTAYNDIGALSLIKKISLFVISAITSAGLSAWLLSPALISLQEGKLEGISYSFNFKNNFDFVNIFSKLFVSSYDTITYQGLPNIFCGMLVLLLVVSYFFIKSISAKEKILSFFVIALFLLSFYFKSLDIIWQVFQTPNWFPFRYSFIFCFFMIFIAYKAFLKVREIPIGIFVSFFIIYAIISYFIFKMKLAYLPVKTIYFSLIILELYLITVCCFRFKEKFRVVVLIALVIISIYEMSNNSLALIKGLDHEFGYVPNNSFVNFNDKISPLVDKAKSLETGFFRMEKTFERSKNDALSLDYNGFAHYSATYNKKINSLLKNLGFAQDWFWSSYYGSTIVTDSIFGVKYVMSTTVPNNYYIPIKKSDDVTLYKNPYAISLGFLGNEKLINTNIYSNNYLDNQNTLLKSITNSKNDYFNIIDNFEIETQNIITEKENDFTRYTSNKNGTASITFRFIASNNSPIYAYIPSDTNDGCSIYINNNLIGQYLSNGETKKVIYIGSFKEGETVEIKLQLLSSKLDIKSPYIYSLDMDRFTKSIELLHNQQLNITNFSSTNIKGTINVTDKTVMFTSIPYDKGWVAISNGKEVKTGIYANSLLYVRLPEGENVIELRYTPQGFIIGLSISLIFLVLTIAFLWFFKYRKKRLLM